MTIQQIINLSRIKLLELTPEVISDETLLTYAQLCDIDLVKRTFTNDKILSATVVLVNGVGTLPTGFGTLYGTGIDSSNNRYEEVSPEDFSNEINNYIMTVEGGVLKVSNKSITSINIKYYPTFETLTVSSTPSVNEYFHECMIYGIIARAFEDLQDQELALTYNSKYESMCAQRGAIQSNYEEGNQRGGVMFNYTKLI